MVCPPRGLHPLLVILDLKLAHSERFVLPRIMAPDFRNLDTTDASLSGLAPTKAQDPDVVSILSRVTILSLTRIGTPCQYLFLVSTELITKKRIIFNLPSPS